MSQDDTDPADGSSTIFDVRAADLRAIRFRNLVANVRRHQSTSGTPTGIAWHLWYREEVRRVFGNTSTLLEHVRRTVGESPARARRRPFIS